MILAINKWPPGGAGVVLTSKTWNFHKFSVDFGDFWTIFRWILEFWAHTLALKVNVRSIPQVPNLLTSKPLKTSRNTQKLLSKPTKPLENRNFLIVLPKNANILLKYEKKKSQQHPVFPGGHPSKYWLGSMLLNFSDRTRTGVFNMIWPLARIQENFNIIFQQHTCMYNTSQFLQCKKNCHTVTKTCKVRSSTIVNDTGTDTGTTVGRLWEDFVTTVWLWIYPEFTPNLPPKVVLNEEKVLKKS